MNLVNEKNIISLLQQEYPNFKKEAAQKLLKSKDHLINGYAQSLVYKTKFIEKNISLHDVLASDLNSKNLVKGQLVTYVNEYGFCFPNFEIVGFDNFCNDDRCVYLNFDSYWNAVPVSQIIVQDGFIYLSEEDIAEAKNHQANLYH